MSAKRLHTISCRDKPADDTVGNLKRMCFITHQTFDVNVALLPIQSLVNFCLCIVHFFLCHKCIRTFYGQCSLYIEYSDRVMYAFVTA